MANKDYGYGQRADGSNKGNGYFGMLQRTDNPNYRSSEISLGVEIDGKEIEIPAMVPTLTKSELDYLLGTSISFKDPVNITNKDKDMFRSIERKAIQYARKRIAAGKSPFAQEGEQGHSPILEFKDKATTESIPLEAIIDYIIPVESGNNPFAENKKSGARGLTQLTKAAWKDLQTDLPEKYGKIPFKVGTFNPEVSRQAGLDYLDIIDKYFTAFNIDKTLNNYLAAYNWGIGNLRNSIKNSIPLPEETQNYIKKIREMVGL